MSLYYFDANPNKKILFKRDNNGREISYYFFNDVIACGEDLFYPNTLLMTIDKKVYKPLRENTMSLKNAKICDNEFDIKRDFKYDSIDQDNNFFFVYNTDNYYHFVYDTLPYLITYKELKKEYPNLKLLMNYPNSSKHSFYTFVLEFLELSDVNKSDIKIIKKDTLYKNLIISTSYTHDIDSNLPPREEIYNLFKNYKTPDDKETPKKIYVSRRSWVHGDFSNIGTNYTTRRKMVNEDALVELLNSHGFQEVFTENLSTIQKINYFKNAEIVVGSIGGGICNVLFSNKKCKLIALISPTFLNVNKRFKYSLDRVDLHTFEHTKHTESKEFKTFMRVQVGTFIGEIISIENDYVTISYSDTKVSGWNNDIKYKTMTVLISECTKLDDGLNSPWEIDLVKFKQAFL